MRITYEMLERIVYNSIFNARNKIYKKIQFDVQERSFYSDIRDELKIELNRNNLTMYFIDIEYNRAVGVDGMGKGVGIYNKRKKTVDVIANNAFDMVVHLNGEGDINYPENLIHIEIKKYNNEQGRVKDEERLMSTTKFPTKFSTHCLGMIINPDIFKSFYNVYQSNSFFLNRAQQMQDKLDLIEKINKELYNTVKVDYSKTNKWFSNIIAGYQLGVFIDISQKGIEITYFYSGNKKKQERISYFS